jgi:hypothetical protein
VPAKPVKFSDLKTPAELIVSKYVPTVTLKLSELASVNPVATMIVAVALLFDMFTVGVPDTVREVLLVLNTVPDPLVVMLPVPNAKVRVPEVELNNPVESVKVDNVKVPPVKVNVLVVPNVSALPNVTLNALLIELLIITPLVVIVLVAAMVKVPVFDHVVVADRVMLPETVIPIDPAIVQVAPMVVRDRQGLAVPLTVMVGEPEAALTITASTAVGTLAPPPPPDVALQLVVLLASQVPEPPTQYLSAIIQFQAGAIAGG